jgi:hypothetical protein
MRYKRTMRDIVVTCLPHSTELCYYPQIQGHYLAKHLIRLGLAAEFRQLPLPPSYRCRVAISSEYPAEMEWFERHLLGPLTGLAADRLFCLMDYTLGSRDHFARPTLEWFGQRGGVLCYGVADPPAPWERWIGVGVDTEVVPGPATVRDSVLFDPVSAAPKRVCIDPVELKRIRRRLPGVRLLASGREVPPIQLAFDGWLPYGQPHPAYVKAALGATFAVVPMEHESLGLMLAEAQVAGACIVHGPYAVKGWMMCPEADVPYMPDRPGALAEALVEATHRDPRVIAAQARRTFNFTEVARRTRAAIGL